MGMAKVTLPSNIKNRKLSISPIASLAGTNGVNRQIPSLALIGTNQMTVDPPGSVSVPEPANILLLGAGLLGGGPFGWRRFRRK